MTAPAFANEEPATESKATLAPDQSRPAKKKKKKEKVEPSETMLNGSPSSPGTAPFKPGEKLEFEVTWFNIKGGVATMEVDGFDEFEGQSALHLKTTAVSSKAFSMFIKVEDVGESWIHPTGLYSLGYVTNQKEGGRKEFQRVVLDNEAGVAHSYRKIEKKNDKVKRKDQELKMARTHVQDALSMFYYFRAFDLADGDKLETHVHTSRKTWEFSVKVVGKEKIKTPVGTFDTLKLRPSVRYKGKPQNKGTMTIWVTDDARKIPVKLSSDVKIGKVNMILINYEEGGEL